MRKVAIDEIERLDADWLVLCGSIPTRTDRRNLVPFTELLRKATARGVRIAVDTSEVALTRAVSELPSVDLVEPDTHELVGLVRERRTIGEVVVAAAELRTSGVETVYVSMGKGGALAVAEQPWRSPNRECSGRERRPGQWSIQRRRETPLSPDSFSG